MHCRKSEKKGMLDRERTAKKEGRGRSLLRALTTLVCRREALLDDGEKVVVLESGYESRRQRSVWASLEKEGKRHTCYTLLVVELLVDCAGRERKSTYLARLIE